MLKKDYTTDTVLMNAKFPSQQKIFKDDSIYEEISLMKEVVNLIRKTRSDLHVHPKSMINAFFVSDDNNFNEIINKNSDLIIHLVNLKEIHINATTLDIDECIIVNINKSKIYLPIKNIIDIEKERMRLVKNIENLENNLKKINSKLNNKNFIEKAPSEVIDSNYQKQKYFISELESAKELLNCLSD